MTEASIGPIQSDGERKQVTVLFADVKGSMDMAEGQDPEEWRRIMQRFFSILSDGVHRFEGTVDKFTGDGIMAVFGAPIAHEDHARRACYAALRMLDDVTEYSAELRRTHGLNFSTRIGINSGEVVAGAIGEVEGSGYTAVGHTVGLAQRMEALAEPGKAYLTEGAAALAGGYFELEDLGEFEVKGASRPIEVFELVGVGEARSRLDVSRARGLSRFVGRSDEMVVLEEALERAERGEGSVVGIVAEPGVGKSRICHEFAERCRTRGIEVFEAQAQSHGQATPFIPVLQMLRAYFGIEERDSEQATRERIAGRMLLMDPEFAADLPLLFDFLGVPDPERPVPPMSGEARERALRGIVRKLANAPRRSGVVVNVVEDLHWMDAGSDSFLAEFIDAVTGTQSLVVVNFRPEYSAEWTSLPVYREIQLVPLGIDDTRELLRHLVGEDPSLDGLPELIHERTAGNPFFIEEIVRELIEAGHLEGEAGAYRLAGQMEELSVPASVQAVLAARIDRLAPAAKQLLQAASVVGKEASEETLGLVTGLDGSGLEAPLDELLESRLLYEAEVYPERVLAFSHPLTREVAYGTQLAEQRSASHAAAARALVERHPERHDELAALIAQHMENGGETLEAARWSARAAYWAGHSHPHDALRGWRKVMELSEELEEGEEAAALAVSSRILQLDYGWRLGMEGEEAERLAAEATEIATRCGDHRSLAILRMLTSGGPGVLRATDGWVEAVDDAVRLADETGDPHLRVSVRAAGAYSKLCAARFDAVDATVDEVLEIAGEDRSAGAGIIIGSPVAWSLAARAITARERGEFEESRRLGEAGLRIAEEQGDPETASWIRGGQAITRAMYDDAEAGVALARRNCELTERLGDVFTRGLALANLALPQALAGDFAESLDSIERSERLYRSAMEDGGEMAPWRGGIRTMALVGAQRTEEGIAVAEEAAHVARTYGLLWPLPFILRGLGQARAAAGDPDAAREAFGEGIDVADRTGAATWLRNLEEDREKLGAVA